MKPRVICFVILSTALTLASTVAAQSETSTLLAAAQVRDLVASEWPSDHLRLQVHFAHLSSLYAAEASRQIALGRTSAGNPNRWQGGDPVGYHNQLAAAATRSAEITRRLSAHHGRLAKWMPSALPLNAEPFEDGAGAPAVPPKKELLLLAARARTPNDHGILAEYYSMLADAYTADADKHSTMARAFRMRANNRTPGADPAVHCDRRVHDSRAAARTANRLAREYREMVGAE